MDNMKNLLNKAKYYKDLYPPGTRIQLISMEDPYDPVPDGTKGTVEFVDDLGQLHMKWDNGRTLAIVPSQDRFRKLTSQEIAVENSLNGKIENASSRVENNAIHTREANEISH